MVTSLKWWFLFCASILGVGAAAMTGMFDMLWSIDHTRISFIIIGLYFTVSAFVGWMTWREEKGVIVPKVHQHMHSIEVCCESFMMLAMMATTMGFYLVIRAWYSNGGQINPQSITEIMTGLGVIYLCTFVGLLAAMLMKWQLANLRYVVTDETT